MASRQVPVAVLRRLHLVLIGAWIILIVPAVLFWSTSVPFLVFISIYANVAGHFSAWQGARSEEASE